METDLQNLSRVMLVYNFVFAERHKPGLSRGYIHLYIRDVQHGKVKN